MHFRALDIQAKKGIGKLCFTSSKDTNSIEISHFVTNSGTLLILGQILDLISQPKINLSVPKFKPYDS